MTFYTDPDTNRRYELTGEMRAPQEGEFYISYPSGCVFKAGFANETGGETRRIVKLSSTYLFEGREYVAAPEPARLPKAGEVYLGKNGLQRACLDWFTIPCEIFVPRIMPSYGVKTYRHDGKLLVVESEEPCALHVGEYFLRHESFIACGPVKTPLQNMLRIPLTEAFPILSGFEPFAPSGQLFVRTGERRPARKGEWIRDSRGLGSERGAALWTQVGCIFDCDILKPHGVKAPEGWELTGEWRKSNIGEAYLAFDGKSQGITYTPRWILRPVASQVQTPAPKISRFASPYCTCSRGWGEQCDCSKKHSLDFSTVPIVAPSDPDALKSEREILRVVGPVPCGDAEVVTLRANLARAVQQRDSLHDEFCAVRKKLENIVKTWQGQCAMFHRVAESSEADLIRLRAEYEGYKARVEKAVKG